MAGKGRKSAKRSKLLIGIDKVDYKDAELLKNFMTDYGKIIPARVTGVSSKQQRQLKNAISRARAVGLVL